MERLSGFSQLYCGLCIMAEDKKMMIMSATCHWIPRRWNDLKWKGTYTQRQSHPLAETRIAE